MKYSAKTLWAVELLLIVLLLVAWSSLDSIKEQSRGVSLSPPDVVVDYGLDSVSQGTTIDRTGANNGTVSGATTVSGIRGNALQFDGVDDYVQASASLNPGNRFSVSFWFKGTKTQGNQVFAGKTDRNSSVNSSSLNSSWSADISANSGVCPNQSSIKFYVSRGNSRDTVYVIECGQTYQDGNWHHFAGVFEGGSKIEMYIDGQKKGAVTGDIRNVLEAYNSREPLLIGKTRARWESESPYQGQIDEFRLYNRALAETEIVGLNLAMRHELQVSYDFESASNNVVQDASPTDRDGTIVGPVIVQGIGSNALQFDGIDDYVQASASLNPGSRFSVSFWFKGTKTLGNQIFAGKWDGTSGKISWFADVAVAGGICPNQAGIDFYVSEDGGASDRVYVRECGQTYQDGQWHLFTGVFEGGSKIEMYIDGQKKGTVAGNIGNVLEAYGNTNPMLIGKAGAGSAYQGQIDELKLYNKVLTESEATSTYEQTILVASHHFEDIDSNNKVQDSSAYDNDGQVTGAREDDDGIERDALFFDGDRDYVRINDQPSLDFAGGSFTASIWFRSNSSDEQVILDKSNSTRGRYYKIYMDNGIVKFDARCAREDRELESASSLDNNAWHHVVAVMDNSLNNKRLLYIDGELEDEDSNEDCKEFSTTGELSLGAQLTPSRESYFKGTLDEFALYARALSAGEIERIYDSLEDNDDGASTSNGGRCRPSWNCVWNACVNNVETYTCTDARNCRTNIGKPAETNRTCATPTAGGTGTPDSQSGGDIYSGDDSTYSGDSFVLDESSAKKSHTIVYVIIGVLAIAILVVAGILIFLNVKKSRRPLQRPVIQQGYVPPRFR